MKSHGYVSVTEVPGTGATGEQLAMLSTRYAFAGERCAGKRVLEVACGAGMGLGYLKTFAHRLVGGDCDLTLLEASRDSYHGRIPLVALDAHHLPFRDESFDVVILFEAIYYLRDVERFLDEARRILGRGGLLLLCSANREWPGFNPSPFSVSYLSAADLASLLHKKEFDVELFTGFPAVGPGFRSWLVAGLRRLAVALHLIPTTMRGKKLLKRVFIGPLRSIPREVTPELADACPLVPIAEETVVPRYKVLYAVGRVR